MGGTFLLFKTFEERTHIMSNWTMKDEKGRRYLNPALKTLGRADTFNLLSEVEPYLIDFMREINFASFKRVGRENEGHLFFEDKAGILGVTIEYAGVGALKVSIIDTSNKVYYTHIITGGLLYILDKMLLRIRQTYAIFGYPD